MYCVYPAGTQRHCNVKRFSIEVETKFTRRYVSIRYSKFQFFILLEKPCEIHHFYFCCCVYDLITSTCTNTITKKMPFRRCRRIVK